MERNVRITQTAKYVPEHSVTNHDLAKIMDTSDEWITSRTGIKARRIADMQDTSDLCTEVAKKLLEKSHYLAETLDFIIVATMTPDYATPSTACLVQGNIGAKNAFCFDISAACSGFVYALATAEKLIQSGGYQKGIVIGGEVLSKAVNWKDRSTAVLFGDGAGGVMLEASQNEGQFIAEILHADGTRGGHLTSGKVSRKAPFAPNACLTKEEVSYLSMDGREIFDFALRDATKSILEVLEQANLSKEELDFVVPHQANIRILEGMAKKAKIPREKFLTNIAQYGNTSAATIPILLDESIENGTLTLGSKQKIVLTGFGGGLTWGSMLLSL